MPKGPKGCLKGLRMPKGTRGVPRATLPSTGAGKRGAIPPKPSGYSKNISDLLYIAQIIIYIRRFKIGIVGVSVYENKKVLICSCSAVFFYKE